MFIKTFASGGITVSNIDTMVAIPEVDYVTHQSLCKAFSDAIVAKLVFKVTGFAASNLSGVATTQGYRNKVIDSGIEHPIAGTTYNDFRLHIQITCSATSFAWGEPLNFQCLNIPTSTVYNLDNGSGAIGDKVETTQLFNDSYILLGGKRIEEFEGSTTTPVYDISQHPKHHSVL